MFLEIINLSTLTKEQALKPAGIISETELLKVLKPKKNDKITNDRITKAFYEFFCDNIKNSLFDLIRKSFKSGELPICQKQAVIKLSEKKDRRTVNQELEPNFYVKYRY